MYKPGVCQFLSISCLSYEYQRCLDVTCLLGYTINISDGIVSHVCAVNLFDGNTPLHRTIEGGDNPAIVSALLEADPAVINMQNDAGMTAVHLACKLGRKKILEKLLVGIIK